MAGREGHRGRKDGHLSGTGRRWRDKTEIGCLHLQAWRPREIATEVLLEGMVKVWKNIIDRWIRQSWRRDMYSKLCIFRRRGECATQSGGLQNLREQGNGAGQR